MRIAPHVLWADGPDDLIRRVVRDGIATHGHPRALVGALAYAFALSHAATSRATHGFGDSVEAAAVGLIDADRILPALPHDWGTAHDLEVFAATWQETNKETAQLLALVSDSLQRGAMSNPDSTLERLGCADPKINGAGTVSAAAAIYLASRFAARPQDGLVSAAFLRKADTDTLASLTAAILGALHDTQWLGSLANNIQDAPYIMGLAERSVGRVIDPLPWPTRHPRTLRRTLADALLHREARGEFPDGRQYLLEDMTDLQDGHVMRARLRLDDGQAVFVDLHAGPVTAPGREVHEHCEQPSGGQGHAPRRLGDERKPATNNGTDSADITPKTPARPFRAGASVVLATHNLTKSAAFYAQLTGREISVHGDTAEIAPGLTLHRFAADAVIDGSSVIVQIVVDNLPATKRRLGLDRNALDGPTGAIEVRDLDGRVVRVSQRPTNSPM
jgi:hypothetical protein